MSGEGAPRLGVRVRAEDIGYGCPACQLYGLLVDAGREVDGEAFADFHAYCTAPAPSTQRVDIARRGGQTPSWRVM